MFHMLTTVWLPRQSDAAIRVSAIAEHEASPRVSLNPNSTVFLCVQLILRVLQCKIRTQRKFIASKFFFQMPETFRETALLGGLSFYWRTMTMALRHPPAFLGCDVNQQINLVGNLTEVKKI